MTTTTPYAPSAGLARNVIEFFVSNRDEVLDTNDLVSKFAASKASIPALLKRARECGAIVYNGGLYMLGNFSTAQQCLQQPDTDVPAAAPTQTPVPATAAEPIARGIDSATPAQWDAAAAATRTTAQPPAKQQQPKPPQRGLIDSSITVPGIGTLRITLEPLASRIPVSGHKWDPLLDHISAHPISVVENELVTVRLPKAMAGAAKAGIESWHKRHAAQQPPCRFRASVAGDEVLIQRIA
jgi:hypothetical protein